MTPGRPGGAGLGTGALVGLVVLALAVLAALSPQRTTRAAWVDTASVTSAVDTLDVTPTLQCSPTGFDVTVSWSRPATPYGTAPVSYTATIRRNGGGLIPLSVTVGPTAADRSALVVGTITLVDYPVLVEVTATLPGTSWTATSTMTVVVRGLLNGWQVTCP